MLGRYPIRWNRFAIHLAGCNALTSECWRTPPGQTRTRLIRKCARTASSFRAPCDDESQTLPEKGPRRGLSLKGA